MATTGAVDLALLQRLRHGHALRRQHDRVHDVGGLGAGRGERRDEVRRVRRVAHALERDPGRLQAARQGIRRVGDSRRLGVDHSGGLGLQDLLREGRERRQDADEIAEQDVAVLVLRIRRARRHAVDHGLRPVDRRHERLRTDGHRTDCDDVDAVVVGELLTAALTLLLGRRREARGELDRVAVDATQLLVDVLDGELRAVCRVRARIRRSALLVGPADDDLALARVGGALGAPRVLHVVRDRGPRRGRPRPPARSAPVCSTSRAGLLRPRPPSRRRCRTL